MQVEYQPSQPIPMKRQSVPNTVVKPVYSLSEKLFDPEPSPPTSDFMKRLYERHIYYNAYNMVEKTAKPPNT
jgi:hypothetical protein